MSDLPALLDPAIGPALARRLLAAIFLQAVRDGRRRPRRSANRRQFASYSQDALRWLNQPRTRRLAEEININLPERVTKRILRQEVGEGYVVAPGNARRKAVQP